MVPSNETNWDDVAAVFGDRGPASRCWCQRYKLFPGESFAALGPGVLAERMREQTRCGDPSAETSSGLVAYLGDEPVGWCAVEPRPAYPRMLRNMRVPWEGRTEDKDDEGVWAVTCFVTRAGYRKRGITHALAHAAVDFARERGARALEGYPITTRNVILSELHAGTIGAFEAAGFTEVSRPTIRRAVMRIDS
jgi:GNAT superfamily N-acetyltransferase